MKGKIGMILTGLVIGGVAVLLAAAGNPGNMGFCIACFLRDIGGGVHLHSAAAVQNMRLEIFGLVIGAFLAALAFREFKPRGGSSPMSRFIIGFIVMIGALMFLGCPLRMALRIGGGDLNAIVGLVGFAGGILVGILALKKGFTLKRAYSQSLLEGAAFPAINVVFAVLTLAIPGIFALSAEGPGSMSAPWYLCLGAGLIVGALAQRTRLCMVGGIRDAVLFKDFHLLLGFLAIAVAAIVGNLIAGSFKLGFEGQPVAHTDGVWNFLGMALVGWGSVLVGGCPLRQLILAGEGNSDSAVTVLGFVTGAAFCHNFGLASSANGPTQAGQIAVIAGFAVLAVITLMNCIKKKGV